MTKKTKRRKPDEKQISDDIFGGDVDYGNIGLPIKPSDSSTCKFTLKVGIK